MVRRAVSSSSQQHVYHQISGQRRLFRRGTHESTLEKPGTPQGVQTIEGQQPNEDAEQTDEPQPQQQQATQEPPKAATTTATVIPAVKKYGALSDSHALPHAPLNSSNHYGLGIGRGQSIIRPATLIRPPSPVHNERMVSPRVISVKKIRSDPQEYTRHRDYSVESSRQTTGDTSTSWMDAEESGGSGSGQQQQQPLRSSNGIRRSSSQVRGTSSAGERAELKSSKGRLVPKDVRVLSTSNAGSRRNSSESSPERVLSAGASPSRSRRSTPIGSPAPSRTPSPIPSRASSGQFSEAEEGLPVPLVLSSSSQSQRVY